MIAATTNFVVYFFSIPLMVIKQIKVTNFRLLKDFSIDLQRELSLIVGKNNVGKTSLLYVLDKFLNGNYDGGKKFRYNDFNLDFQKEIEAMLDQQLIRESDYVPKSISLRIIVEYYPNDSLDNIGNTILLNLEEDNNLFALGFDYQLDYQGYISLMNDYKNAQADYAAKYQADEAMAFNKQQFLEEAQERYFAIVRKSVYVKKEDMSLDEANWLNLNTLKGFILDDIINFKYISARRNVDNKGVNNTLSEQTSDLYNIQEDNQENEAARNEFLAHLKDTDTKLTDVYGKMFAEVVRAVERFGGMKRNETVIRIISTLQHRELLKGNTTVVYEHDSRNLPESYNGLGYMNLISIIFEISLIVGKMKRMERRRPADINLIFIEEPEAHTHPQMQYVFIKNIKDLLNEGIKRDGASKPLQAIVSTHSSHIVADSDFDDIKYLKRVGHTNCVVSKNLCDLKDLYAHEAESYKFLKQYLTLINSELFFADKAIFVEGDTERILMPVMMQKVDTETPPNIENGDLPLRSQNISLLPIGAHSHIFEQFFHFIGIEKLLIITDIDICEKNGHHRKCRYKEGESFVTSNSALKHYFGTSDIDRFRGLTKAQRLLKWNDAEKKMNPDTNGNMLVCYQTEVNGYQARSFEDCFFKTNEGFICEASFETCSLDSGDLKTFRSNKDPYDLAENGVKSKAALAISLLLAESEENEWVVPDYIKEGLLWIRS